MARDEKSEVKKLFEQYVCASFCFFSFFHPCTRVQCAERRKSDDNEYVPLTEIFRRDETTRGRERVDLRKDERGRDGEDEKGIRIWNTSFSFLISSPSVE